MRRLLAAAGAAALSLAIAVPIARAATPDQHHKLAFYTPYKYDAPNYDGAPQPATAPDNALVYSTDEIVTVRADFDAPDGVKGWEVKLVPASGGPGSSCREDIDPQGRAYPTTVYIRCPWDTTRAVDRTLDKPTPAGAVGNQNFDRNWHLADHGPSANGQYTIVVTVWNAGYPDGFLTTGLPGDQPFTLNDPDAKPSRSRQVWVVNDVADPTGVASPFDPATNRINVTWAPNPEPDVSYLVQEKVGDGKWGSPIAVPGSATNYVRTVDKPGKYQYQVAAVRPAPTDKSASATKTSDFVAAPAVTVDQVSPPTTAGVNGPDGTIDHSGDNGVFLPTDSPSSTAPGSKGKPGKATSAGGRSSVAAGSGPSGSSSSRATGSSGGSAAGEAEGEGLDEGFSATLPFDQTQDGSTDGLGSGDEQPESMSKLVNVPRPQDARALLIPMAGALVVFMLAMQLMVWVRRRPAMATTGDDFDDWMGY